MSQIDLLPFHRAHLAQLHEQDATRHLEIPEEILAQVEREPWSVTLRVDGRVILCGGVRQLTPWMGEAWAVLDRDAGQWMTLVHRTARRVIDTCPLPRVQAVAELRFKPALRWLRILGFQQESPRMRSYHGPGVDCALYSRIR